MNGIRGKTPSSPPPQVQGQQQQRGINYSFVGAEEFNPNYQQISQPQLYQQQFQNYDVSKHSFGAPRMPSPGLGQQPPTTMYQQQGMRGSTPPFFPGNQQNVRQPRFPNVQNPNQQMWGQQIMYMPTGPYQHQGNQPQIIVNQQLPMQQQRMQQPYNPNASMPTTQATGGLYQVPPTGNVSFPHQGYNNPPVYYGQNNPQNRPPSAPGQAGIMPSKKKKTIIKITDPNTGKDIDLGSQQAETSSSGARTTPTASSGTESPAGSTTTAAAAAGAARSPPNEIAAQFAEQVAKAIYNHDTPGGAHPSPQVGSYPSSTSSPQQQQQQQQQQHSGPPPPLQQMPPGPPPGPSPLHQNVQPTVGMPPPNMPNDLHMEGQRMPPHMVQQAMGPGQSAPINIPVNPNRPPVHMDVDVTEMPPPMLPQHGAADPMHNLANHTDMESIDQPPASGSVGSVPGQSQSLSNGTPLAQKPVQSISIQQSVSATSDTVKPSEVKPSSGPVRETSPNKPAPAPVKEIEPTPSLSRGEPVTVSVAKPVSERTVEPSDSDTYKTGPSSQQRGSTPEVHIMPPTPVEKESKVELEVAPVVASKESAEPAVEAPSKSVPKKEKGKKRANRINTKGEKMGGSEFDAYVDKKEEAETETKPEAPAEKPSVPVPEVTSSQEPEKPRETSPVVAPPSQEPEKKGASPVSEVPETVAPTQTLNVPGSDETVPTITIKSVDGPTEAPTEEVVAQQDDDLDNKGEVVEDEESEEVMLKYKYCEDQWSPLNVEGKKHYDREFLLQFQFESAATCKPEGLPDIPDIILDKPLNVGQAFKRELAPGGGDRGGRGGHDSFDFTPNYVWSSSGQGGGGRQSKGLPRQPSNQKNKGPGGPAVRQINVSISKDIELHRAKDAWKPAAKEKKGPAEKNEDDPDDLFKKTRSILNKLTPQKFQTLVSQMQALPIDSETKLKGVIDLVFEKAISEPNFSVAYANMCRCLSMFKVPSNNKPRDMVNFRAVLLTRCQREFEKDKSSEAIFKEKRQEIEAAEQSKRKELQEALEYEESKAKRRSLGNIRFIGELFKLKMLTENIMHDCVFKLLRTKDPENLECLCRLLTTIGKELDVDKAKPRMDQYFQQMQKIVNDKKMSSRVRFMLQDVIDLRLNKWVPRRVDNNPKTIDQIHKEVEQEAQEKALLSQQAHMAQKQTPHGGGGRGGGGRRGGPPGQMGGGGGGADGWNTVGGGRSTPLRSVDRSIDPTKIRFSKQNVDESNIQLGPGGGASRFSGWGRGSTGGTTSRPSQEKEKQAPNTPANRFSVLNKPEEDSSRRYQGTSPARGDSRGRGGFGRPPSLSARHSQESEREKALSAAKAIGGRPSQEAPSRERSRGRDPGQEAVQTASLASDPKELSVDEMEKKTNSILDEYLHIQDLKEAILCVRELSSNNHHHFVYHSINHVIERSQVARRQTGHLLHDLVKDNVISSQAYLKGLLDVLEFAEDMEIDIPKIWQYYGELISPMIQDGSVQLSFLKAVCQPLLTSNKAGVLLAQVLHDASHREGHKKVAGLWEASGLQWTDFVPKNQVDQFLKDMDLEFTKGGDSAPTTPTTGLPVKEIADQLHQLIVVQGVENEKIFDWIESNVDEPTTKQSKFIRALMTAVCNSAIKGDKGKERVEPKDIRDRNDLLQKYLDHQPDSELQALYALQALVTKLEHPPGVLRHMFDTLYDEDIISEDAFIQWEKSEDEPDGKGAALKQVVQFFTWLREAEDDS